MDSPELLSTQAGQSAARLVDEMSRLYYLSRAIHVAAELGIADQLDGSSPRLDRIAEATETDADCLSRLLRFLSAYGIFEEKAPGQFCNTALSSVLRSDHPNSLRPSLRRIGAYFWSAVGEMEHSIRTGQPAFLHVHGVSFFHFLKANPAVQARFDEGMARISRADDAAIAAAYGFGRFRRIVDLGGGRGGLLVQILRRAPDARGILFEQPQVITRVARLGDDHVAERSELVAGNFFESVPAGADCYVLKGVLHDFDDVSCLKVLANCRGAMAPSGRIVIANQDLPSAISGPHPNLTMDIQMMTLLGGRERTITQWSALFHQCGLRLGDVFPTDVGFIVVEAAPE
jgi:hypothetical protein